MADPAPGQSAAQTEPVCYNCGMQGHWMVACPEPTRDVPAGLQRWQSQNHGQRQASEKQRPSSDKKGPVVTRYAPPPNHGPVVGQYGVAPGASYPPPPLPPPPPPPSQPHPSSYQPPPMYVPPHPPPGPPPPPQPYYGPYPSTVPPQPFGQHSPPPPPPAYPGYYPPTPPATYPPVPYQPPPYPAHPGYPPKSNPVPPPPPRTYQPGSYPPPPHAFPPPIAPPYPTTMGWKKTFPRHGPSEPRARGKSHKYQGSRRHSSNTRDHKQQPRPERTSPVNADQQRHSAGKDKSPSDRCSSVGEPAGDDLDTKKSPKPRRQSLDDPNDELQEDFEMIFAEHSTKPADPVGIPLPYEYSDCPTIPPAYNATCIKSLFLREDNVNEFSKSVFESKEWDFEHDPVFRCYPGMVVRKFPGYGHSYFTHEPPIRHPSSAPIKLPPPFHISRRSFEESKQERASSQTRHDISRDRSRDHRGRDPSEWYDRNRDGYIRTSSLSAKRSLDDSLEPRGRDWKRSRTKPNRSQSPLRSRQNSVQQVVPQPIPPMRHGRRSPYVEHRAATDDGATVKLYASPDKHASSPEDRGRRPNSSNIRHDSGYQSGGPPQERRRPSPRDATSARRQRERLYSRRRSRSRSPVGGNSSPSSAEGDKGRSRSNSPLTALEAELLGLSHPSESQQKKPPPKKPTKRHIKVASAFSRRW